MSELGIIDIIDLGPSPTTAVRGVTLSVKPGLVTGGPTPKVTIQWLRDGEPIEGANGLTYVTTDDDIDTIITVSQTAVNPLGRAEKASNNTNRFQINGAPPVIPEPPTISGTPSWGNTLTATISTPTGSPTITSEIRWYRDGQQVQAQGDTQFEYIVTQDNDEIGSVISVRHIAYSDWGSTFEDSEPVTIVQSSFLDDISEGYPGGGD